MPLRLNTKESDFEAAFSKFLDANREASADVDVAVAAILADVRARGDEAVLEYTERFDRLRTRIIEFARLPNYDRTRTEHHYLF